MNTLYFNRLFDYNYAAYHRLWNESVMSLSEEDYRKDLGYAWGSVHSQVVHVMSAEWIWFSRLNGESPTAMLNPDDFPNREWVRARWDDVEALAWQYISSLADADLEAVVEYTTTSNTRYQQPRWEILAHIANHGTDHRSQMLAMIHQLGGKTFDQDLAHYLRGKWVQVPVE